MICSIVALSLMLILYFNFKTYNKSIKVVTNSTTKATVEKSVYNNSNLSSIKSETDKLAIRREYPAVKVPSSGNSESNIYNNINQQSLNKKTVAVTDVVKSVSAYKLGEYKKESSNNTIFDDITNINVAASPVINGKVTKTFLTDLFKLLNVVQVVYINKNSGASATDKKALFEMLSGYNDYITKYRNDILKAKFPKSQINNIPTGSWIISLWSSLFKEILINGNNIAKYKQELMNIVVNQIELVEH